MTKALHLYQKCRSLTDKILSDLKALVEIETPTGHTEGILREQEILKTWFEEIGASVQILPFDGGANLIATLRGTGTKKLMLLAHADTVFEVGTLSRNPYRIEDGQVRGPGCIDCKGGIILGIYALKLLKEENYTDYDTITFVVNGDEETGSDASRDLIVSIAKQHDAAIVLEASKQNHGACVSRGGMGQATITVHGVACHACRYEKGANALEEMAHQILQLRTLSDPSRKTSVSCTVCQAGEVANAIPDLAVCKVDVRYQEQAEYDRVVQEARKFTAQPLVPGTTVHFQIKAHPAFPENPATEAMAAKLKSIYTEIHEPMEPVTSPGISDANYIYPVGTPVIDGLSFVGINSHSVTEQGEVASIPSHLYGLTRFLQEL